MKDQMENSLVVSDGAKLRIAQEDIEFKTMRCAQLLDQVVALHTENQSLKQKITQLEAKPVEEETSNG